MQLYKVQLNKGKGWQDMSYSARTKEEANAILIHYQSSFPTFTFRLREYN